MREINIYSRRYLELVLLSALINTFGCQPKSPQPIPAPLTCTQAINYYNTNISAVQPFRANITDWQVQFKDQHGQLRKFNEHGGKMYYQPPAKPGSSAMFYLRANAPFKTGLVAGSNESEFWWYSKWAELGQWGKYEHLGKPCAQNISFSPQLILEFIGLLPIPEKSPYPVYKIRPETNVIEYIAVDDDSFSIKREIIIDRRNNLPIEINTYGTDGRRIIHSKLTNYKPLADAMLPADIFLSSPAYESHLHLKLRNFKLDQKHRPKWFPRPEPAIEHYQQIDIQCEND